MANLFKICSQARRPLQSHAHAFQKGYFYHQFVEALQRSVQGAKVGSTNIVHRTNNYCKAFRSKWGADSLLLASHETRPLLDDALPVVLFVEHVTKDIAHIAHCAKLPRYQNDSEYGSFSDECKCHNLWPPSQRAGLWGVANPIFALSSRGFKSNAVLEAKPKLGPSGEIPSKKGKKKQGQSVGPPVERPYVPSQPVVIRSSPQRVVEIYEGITLEILAQRVNQPLEAVEGMLASLGESGISASQPVGIDAAELVALEFGADVKRVRPVFNDSKVNGQLRQDGSQVLPLRPPVITVMGHVDHGKTSLLDALRKTSVAAGEAGGITQHMGAFVVPMPSGASLTFLDTPGHAAFSAMRARGAAVTDVVVLVVAADDGVMPQTLEALAHAQAAKVPIVVAINKCDKPEANPSKVRQQLCAEGLELEEIGGDVQVVEISATKGTGLDKLEEALLLTAELMDLRARVDGDAHAVVVEARVDRGYGPLATVIVQSGTLVSSLFIVVGTQWGRIRSLRDTLGRQVGSAGPSTPVEIDGLRGVPLAGDEVLVVPTEERARKLSQMRQLKMEQERLQKLNRKLSSLASDPTEEEKAEKVEMALVVKADVQGTAEAVSQAIESLNSPQVAVNIVHTGVGPVSQSDVDLAEACGACIVGFNVRSIGGAIDAAARRAKVVLRQHRVIYHLLEDIGSLIVDKAPGVKETRVAGQAEVLNVYELKGKGRAGVGATKIAGCRVFDGRIQRDLRVKVLRSGEVLFEGSLQSLRREKLDVEAVGKGTECGMIVQDWTEFHVGDIVQFIEDVKRMPKFISSESGAVRIEC
ncbi:hypothetical protein O6H91_11G030200 [Diphasiastrum complanatum]|uniref:Uncharacterized protein n=1 Tax=Diphasiastrum complanatum TaxID=34168 RepID=A0ACC2C7L1_DIPCM|nr:hypothetical protein O6H91_11G030200 [Diphasiastrum complanatum]